MCRPLQLRDVGTNGEEPGPDFQRYDLGELSDRYFVRGGEVVFRSRGEPNAAAAIPDPLPEPVAVIVPLVIVRPDRRRVLPEYLAWAINQPDAQRKLGAEAQGTSLRMIPMAALEDLEIAVPDLQTQETYRRARRPSARQEGRLLRQLAARRENTRKRHSPAMPPRLPTRRKLPDERPDHPTADQPDRMGGL